MAFTGQLVVSEEHSKIPIAVAKYRTLTIIHLDFHQYFTYLARPILLSENKSSVIVWQYDQGASASKLIIAPKA